MTCQFFVKQLCAHVTCEDIRVNFSFEFVLTFKNASNVTFKYSLGRTSSQIKHSVDLIKETDIAHTLLLYKAKRRIRFK
jgi:hypothetical protein